MESHPCGDSPARVVSVRSWLAAPRGNSLSFLPLRFRQPVAEASSRARSRERFHGTGPATDTKPLLQATRTLPAPAPVPPPPPPPTAKPNPVLSAAEPNNTEAAITLRSVAKLAELMLMLMLPLPAQTLDKCVCVRMRMRTTPANLAAKTPVLESPSIWPVFEVSFLPNRLDSKDQNRYRIAAKVADHLTQACWRREPCNVGRIGFHYCHVCSHQGRAQKQHAHKAVQHLRKVHPKVDFHNAGKDAVEFLEL